MLSRAEQNIADWLATGKQTKEIADILCVTEGTVKFHITNIYSKLGAKNRADFLVNCRGFGVQTPEDPRANNQVQIIETKPETRGLAMGEIQNNQGFRQTQVAQKSQEEKINFVNEKFMVTDTLTQLHKMMTEVTEKEINPATVNAACNCVARLNETVNTAITAARFLNEK